MLNPAAILARHHGVARGRLLQKYGLSRSHLADAVRSGLIIRLRPGVFALSTTESKLVVAAQHGGALTCADALRAYGIWTLPDIDYRVHVWMGGSGREHPHDACTCVVHFSPGTAGIALAPLRVVLLHAFRCLGSEAFFAAYESAWNSRRLSAADQKFLRRALPRGARWLLDFARPDAQSGLESLLRLRLHLLGIAVECQVEIAGVGRVDHVIGGRLIIEEDGHLNHGGADRRHRDLRRDAAASTLGYETLRFDYAMIVHDWDAVIAAIRAALERAAA